MALSVLSMPACAAPLYASAAGGRTQAESIDVDGEARDFILFTPHEAVEPAGVLIVLHGGIGGPERMNALGFEALAWQEVFARRYECGGTAAEKAFDDGDPDNGTHVAWERGAGCADKTPLELLVIEGGEHRWPGSRRGNRSARPGRLTDVATQDINGAETVWNFFNGAGLSK